MPEEQDTKRCGHCKTIKALTDFGLVNGKPRSFCRACHNASMLTPDTRTEKKCPKCKQVKPISQFNKCGARFQPYCRPCSHEVTTLRHEIKTVSGEAKTEYRIYYMDVRRWVRMKSRHGIDRATYEAMFDNQNGVCAICQRPERDKYLGRTLMLSVDHDHVTGKVRGLLCRACNMIIGKFRDDPVVAQRAADYLRLHEER